ncbi:MAG: hypothetical protein LCH41_01550 [Armatimonadetes bacterium]|nr:hypothetical protein [Armatimonadota bacterium]
MRLETDWDGFVAELRDRWPRGARVYLERRGGFTLASAADTEANLVIVCREAVALETIQRNLLDKGHEVRRGRWADDNEAPGFGDIWIAGVAYVSDEKRPGLWMDAFPYSPSQSDILTSMLTEFNEDGTLDPMDNDEFAAFAQPNIVVLDPAEIQTFVSHHGKSAIAPPRVTASPELAQEESE